MEEISAGGVVFNDGNILTLKKFRGDWVLPKGRMEQGETFEDTALREVFEEAGIEGQVLDYIGYLKYNYQRANGLRISKTVHFYLMEAIGSLQTKPLRKEGFCKASFIDPELAVEKLKHGAEKNMVLKAMEIYQED